MRNLFAICVLAVAVALAGCSSKKEKKLDPFAGIGSPHYKGSGPMPKGGGRHHVGKPYQVAGRWFTPKKQPNYDKTGMASWYGEAFNRRKTSNGEWFNMDDMTAAHPTLPLPSYAKVTNLENGREIIVRLNDRGPFVGTRIIDLSKRSADALGFRHQGKANVRVQWIGAAPLNDKGSHLMAMNQALGEGASVSNLKSVASRSMPSASPSVAIAANDTPVRQPRQRAGYTIQVGSFANQANALGAVSMVSQFGPAQLVTTESSDGPLYKTVVGPFRSEAEAAQILEQVQAAGFYDATMTVSSQQVAVLQ